MGRSIIVDNRNKDHAVENRKRYMNREKERLQRAVRHQLKKTGIRDLQEGKDVDVQVAKDTSEHNLVYDDKTGEHQIVGTGNKHYNTGEKYTMPNNKSNSNTGDGEDGEEDFTFTMTAAEFMDFFFDELALPNMKKKVLDYDSSDEPVRAGFVTTGSPARLSILRTYKNSLGRRLAEEEDLKNKLKESEDDEEKRLIEERLNNMILFRETDLRYVNWSFDPVVKHKGVMFCVMDVSWSMREEHKFLAKQFFLLLFVFLKKSYTDVDVVFIRHTTHAEEVDEENFFVAQTAGATLISPALTLVDKIIKERYSDNTYNIYVAQATDGDNDPYDVQVCMDTMESLLLPTIQHYFYIEIDPGGARIRPIVNPYGGFDSGGPAVSAQFLAVERLATRVSNLSAKLIYSHTSLIKSFVELFRKKELKDD